VTIDASGGVWLTDAWLLATLASVAGVLLAWLHKLPGRTTTAAAGGPADAARVVACEELLGVVRQLAPAAEAASHRRGVGARPLRAQALPVRPRPQPQLQPQPQSLPRPSRSALLAGPA
jgi:hypothetical protein